MITSDFLQQIVSKISISRFDNGRLVAEAFPGVGWAAKGYNEASYFTPATELIRILERRDYYEMERSMTSLFDEEIPITEIIIKPPGRGGKQYFITIVTENKHAGNR